MRTATSCREVFYNLVDLKSAGKEKGADTVASIFWEQEVWEAKRLMKSSKENVHKRLVFNLFC